MQRHVLTWCGWLAMGVAAIARGQTAVQPAVESVDQPVAQTAEAAPVLSAPSTAPRAYAAHPRLWNDKVKPWLQKTHWGYADEFHPMTFGASVNEHFKTQVCNGLGAQLVLYAYDFRDDRGPEASLLNSHGQRQLHQIARTAESTGLHPIGIEGSGNATLDAARRDEVIRQLSVTHAAIPAEWVIVGRPNTRGMQGAEAVEVYKNLLNHTKSGAGRSSSEGSGASASPAGASPVSPLQGGSGQE
jgi:hypothetical protein